MPDLPSGYSVERDPDVLVLKADCGRFVAAFSPLGTTEDVVREAAWKDYQTSCADARRSGEVYRGL